MNIPIHVMNANPIIFTVLVDDRQPIQITIPRDKEIGIKSSFFFTETARILGIKEEDFIAIGLGPV